MGKATTASTRNFQRHGENAIQWAMGRPTSSKMADTMTARCRVSQKACQSIAMIVLYSFGDYCCGSVKPYFRSNSATSLVLKYSKNSAASFLCCECDSTATPCASGG